MSITGLGIHIKVKDIEKSRQFYNALGFREVFAYGPSEMVKEDYSGVVFEQGGGKLEIAEGHRAVKPEVFQERGPKRKALTYDICRDTRGST
jgi:catechol 2,3-dioxygenase-like lactoylglutathione lyase family enzyme